MIDDLTKEFIMKLARYSRNEAFLITALASLDEPYLHTAPANGRLCGAERPRCGASGHLLSYID